MLSGVQCILSRCVARALKSPSASFYLLLLEYHYWLVACVELVVVGVKYGPEVGEWMSLTLDPGLSDHDGRYPAPGVPHRGRDRHD